MSVESVRCPIWGQEFQAMLLSAANQPAGGELVWASKSVRVNSERAGGIYEISIDVQTTLDAMSAHEKARLTTWLVDQRMQGDEIPLVSVERVEYAIARRPPSAQERALRLLRYMDSQLYMVGSQVELVESKHAAALAWSGSTNWSEVDYFFEYLRDKGWVEGDFYQNGGFIGTVTVEGHTRIAEREENVDSTQAFVAMWFHESMKPAYEEGIRPAIEAAGYTPIRIDQKEHVNKIDDEIIAEIRRSRFLVADFTQGDDGARGGVYYEAGFAHALDLDVIFTCHKGSLDDLHFDTEHYNHIVWTDAEELRKRLENRILAVVGEGPTIHKTLG